MWDQNGHQIIAQFNVQFDLMIISVFLLYCSVSLPFYYIRLFLLYLDFLIFTSMFHHKRDDEYDGNYESNFDKETENAEDNVYGVRKYDEGQRYQKDHNKSESSMPSWRLDDDNEECDDYKRQEQIQEAQDAAQEHRKHNHLAKLGALGTSAYALYEAYEAKKDPEHAVQHEIKAGAAAAVAAGSIGYAAHEHHKWKDAEAEYERVEYRIE